MVCTIITVLYNGVTKGDKLLRQILSDTQRNILQAGEKEFIAKGFRAASLRTIVKEAGVTTGAFYGYYSSKEELFDALVAEPAEMLLAKFNAAQAEFASLPPAEQPKHLGDIPGDCMDWMLDYIYQNFIAFKLLICCAEGTKYEQLIHTLVEIEVTATHRFRQVLAQLGKETKVLDPQLEHLLVSGQFSAFFEVVAHDMPKEQAVQYVKDLRAFYTAGWQKMLGL